MKASKNGRRECNQKRKYAKLNNSTMNRIYQIFLKKTRINMNLADVPPFNWMMLCPENWQDKEINYDIVKMFCSMDDSGSSNIKKISSSEDIDEDLSTAFDIIKDAIIHEIVEHFDMQTAYISVLKYLFTGENFNKFAHKQMFWRCFGDIAYEILKINLDQTEVCPTCGERYPSWQKEHTCNFDKSEFKKCIDCGNMFKLSGTKQSRCEQCQEKYRKAYIRNKSKSYYHKKKEEA